VNARIPTGGEREACLRMMTMREAASRRNRASCELRHRSLQLTPEMRHDRLASRTCIRRCRPAPKGSIISLNGIQEVRGSTPLGSTNNIKSLPPHDSFGKTFSRERGFDGASPKCGQPGTRPLRAAHCLPAWPAPTHLPEDGGPPSSPAHSECNWPSYPGTSAATTLRGRLLWRARSNAQNPQ
jgi:hypothetical protein